MKKAMIAGILVVAILFSFPLAPTHAQETVSRRDLVIDFGNGLTTDAQLTYPAVGDGPFPGVLLVHGSGSTDMDEYLPPLVTGTGEPSRPFLQIAEYLSERGFTVLRYNKRGIGLNGTVLNQDVVVNTTFQDLKGDAEKALEVLMQQPEVDANDITIIGHSEGTAMAPRIAIEDLRVKKIVLMSAYAQNLSEIIYFQLVDRAIFYAEEVDSNHDGLLSIQEVHTTMGVENVELSPLPPNLLIENSTGEWLWYPGLDADEDGFFSIHEELKPLEIQAFEWFTTSESPWQKWLQSHFALDTNLAVIGNVSASILILQGEGDTQAPVEQAFLLEQRLTEIKHPDHTLITYPGLGHTFYPTDGWIQPLGPIQEYVLSDLAAWLKDPDRTVRYLRSALDESTTVAYIAIGIATIAVIVAVVTTFFRRQDSKMIEEGPSQKQRNILINRYKIN
ncbi:MAG: alpha/beta fold hydrolase [archaeon]|nr:alpha/beta fold hydrolase [archaeon]